MEIGPYRILSPIARGGMGAVYRVRHTELGQGYALKVILTENPDAVSRKRFAREAEMLARLGQHPNIVQVHQYDIAPDGKPYYVMELIEGATDLQDRLEEEEGSLPPEEAARLLLTTARAVAFAHGEGVVHRDLKPANILQDQTGRLVLTDFGLAKPLDARTRLTETGEMLGTLHYMAPEQAAGENEAVGPATDVYALGAILYRLLTGRLPFEGHSAIRLLKKIMFDWPRPMADVDPAIPDDLSTIVNRAMAKRPEQRYPSAGALADDLERFLAGEPIETKASAGESYRWVGLLAALVAGGLLIAWFGFLKPIVERRAWQTEAKVLLAEGDPDPEALRRLTRRGEELARPAPIRARLHLRLAETGDDLVPNVRQALELTGPETVPPELRLAFVAEAGHETAEEAARLLTPLLDDPKRGHRARLLLAGTVPSFDRRWELLGPVFDRDESPDRKEKAWKLLEEAVRQADDPVAAARTLVRNRHLSARARLLLADYEPSRTTDHLFAAARGSGGAFGNAVRLRLLKHLLKAEDPDEAVRLLTRLGDFSESPPLHRLYAAHIYFLAGFRPSLKGPKRGKVLLTPSAGTSTPAGRLHLRNLLARARARIQADFERHMVRRDASRFLQDAVRTLDRSRGAARDDLAAVYAQFVRKKFGVDDKERLRAHTHVHEKLVGETSLRARLARLQIHTQAGDTNADIQRMDADVAIRELTRALSEATDAPTRLWALRLLGAAHRRIGDLKEGTEGWDAARRHRNLLREPFGPVTTPLGQAGLAHRMALRHFCRGVTRLTRDEVARIRSGGVYYLRIRTEPITDALLDAKNSATFLFELASALDPSADPIGLPFSAVTRLVFQRGDREDGERGYSSLDDTLAWDASSSEARTLLIQHSPAYPTETPYPIVTAEALDTNRVHADTHLLRARSLLGQFDMDNQVDHRWPDWPDSPDDVKPRHREAARKHLRRAIELAPWNREAHRLLASIASGAEADRARQSASRLPPAGPSASRFETFLERARTARKEGALDEARLWGETARRLVPLPDRNGREADRWTVRQFLADLAIERLTESATEEETWTAATDAWVHLGQLILEDATGAASAIRRLRNLKARLPMDPAELYDRACHRRWTPGLEVARSVTLLLEPNLTESELAAIRRHLRSAFLHYPISPAVFVLRAWTGLRQLSVDEDPPIPFDRDQLLRAIGWDVRNGSQLTRRLGRHTDLLLLVAPAVHAARGETAEAERARERLSRTLEDETLIPFFKELPGLKQEEGP